MDTWGISGPQLLLLYVALFAVTVPVVVLARRRALAGPPGAAVPARLDRYEAAYLNGGCELVATTAVTGLLRDGVLTSTSRRGRRVRLGVRAAPPAGAHPVEWATYQLVAAQQPPLPPRPPWNAASGCARSATSSTPCRRTSARRPRWPRSPPRWSVSPPRWTGP